MNNPDFLQPETRCGFYVDEKRKKLWKCELDMLALFQGLCSKYGLHYFLIAGGMLGAVRHRGFIPWDDDLDLAMPREDYEIFLEKAATELPEPYFLQTGMNEPYYFDAIARIRDPRTTGIIRKDLENTCNNGIFIEIFPLDNIPDRPALVKLQDCMVRVYQNLLLWSVYDLAYEKRRKRWVMKAAADLAMAVWGRRGIFQKYQKWCTRYNAVPTQERNIVTAYSHREVLRIPQAALQDLIRVPFEYTQVYIPRDYDACLRRAYRDYMELPPVEQRGMKHSEIVLYEPEVDYRSYQAGLRSGKYKNTLYPQGIQPPQIRRGKKW